MLRRLLIGGAVLALMLLSTAASSAAVHEASVGVGQSHDDPFPSPQGLVLRGSHGYEIVVAALAGDRGRRSVAVLEAAGAKGAITYTAPANLAGEGIHASFGSNGRVDLRWVPDGGVREVKGHCKPGLRRLFFFATGAYVGRVRFRGRGGFSEVTAQRIPWQRRWYPMHYGCPRSVSEGLPGPGTILEAGGTHDFWEPVHLSVVQNHPNARVEYGVSESASTGRMEIRRYAFVSGGPKTLTVEPGFRTAEISPPAPFSGTGRFERTEHAHGTWLGDLSVEFPDYSQLRLSGSSFEAILHSGFREESIGGP